jgi:DNA polymerase III delta subunit
MIIYVQGEDSFLAKKAINQIKAKYLQKNPDGAEVIEIDCDGALPNWADLQAVPLFATSRLVIIKRAGLLPEQVQDTLGGYISNLPKTTVAVVWDGKEIKKKNVLVEALAQASKVIQVAAFSRADAIRYVKKRAQELEVDISADQVGTLVSQTGFDGWAIETELQRLATLDSLEDPGSARTAKDEEIPFLLFRLVRGGDWQKVGEQLRTEFKQGKPIELLVGGLAAALRQSTGSRAEKINRTDLLLDVDFGLKTGLLEPESAVALLSVRLSQSTKSTVQWEKIWEEIVS